MRQLVIKFPERVQAEAFIDWLQKTGHLAYAKDIECNPEEYMNEVEFTQFDYKNLVISTKAVE